MIIFIYKFIQLAIKKRERIKEVINKIKNNNTPSDNEKYKNIIYLKQNIGECVICLDDIDIFENIKNLNCNHKFHKECIDLWLQEKNTCPLCRQNQDQNLV